MQFLFVQFYFNMMWHRQTMAAFKFRGRQAESDVTVMLSVTYKNWVQWWSAFLTNMNEKHKSTSPSAIQVTTQCKTICIEEKLAAISQLEKGKRIVDKQVCHNVGLPHSSIWTIPNNSDRITGSANSGTKMFLCAARLPQSYWNKLYQNCGCESLTFLLNTYLLHAAVSFLRS
jgi:hypothetical protein